MNSTETKFQLNKDNDTIEKVLRNTPLFNKVPKDVLNDLSSNCKIKVAWKGQIICKRGAMAQYMYIIRTGSVGEIFEGENGVEVTIKIRKKNDFFGELAILANEPYLVNSIALERTVLIEIPSQQFSEMVWKDYSVNKYIIRILIERLRNSAKWQMSSLYLDAPGKLAYSISKLGQEESNDKGFSITITQDELANICGLARPTVAKILGQWKLEGWMDTTRGKIVIKDKEVLFDKIIDGDI